MDPPPWGNPYGYGAAPADDYEEEEEEVDNDRADDEDFNVDEDMEEEEEEGGGEEEDDEEPEYQDDSEDEDDDEEEDLDEDEQDEEDARQLRAVAHGAPLHHAPAPAPATQAPAPTPVQAAAPATAGIKRRRDEWAPPAAQAAHPTPAASAQPPGQPAPPAAKRNVVRINLRQQTVQPKYAEAPEEEAPRPQPAPAAQPQPAAQPAPQQPAWQQPAWQPPAAAHQPAAVQQAWQPAAAPAPAAQLPVVQQAAVQPAWEVPDWMAHLPPAAPQQQAVAAATPPPWQVSQPASAPKPWEQHMRKVASAGGLASKQSSGSGAWGAAAGSKQPAANFRSTPGFYAESDEEEEADSRAKRARKVPHVLLPEDELALLGDEMERVIKHRDMEGAEPSPADPWASREFFVKWARHSYLHCTWETKATLSQLAGFKRILNYIKKVEEQEQRRPWLSREECELLDVQKQMEEEMVEEYKQVERVIGERTFSDGTVKYLCKWKGLPYCDATYETAAGLAGVGQGAHVAAFQERERRIQESRKTVEAQRRAFASSGSRAFTAQPDYLKGGTLRDYQLDGLNWMVYSWSRGCNGILADEMGLGKTVQCASMIGYLSEVQQIAGPFLVVVPLSTVPNWIREFRKWIPSVNAIVYVGDAQSREVLRAFEWETGLLAGRQYKFDVLITTYEMVIKDRDMLRPIKWGYMMVDEAHRLKNDESALYKELIQWSFKSKLLVTGTPLQNNIRELWALLHFLHPDKFPDSEEFEAEYNMQDPEQVARLHATLRPHLLRRVIKDVEKSLPPKNERILRVGMTPLQRQYYRWILSRNFKELNKGARSQLSLLNIITELKKCCNHPFLFQSAEEEYRLRAGGDDDVATRLVVTSGKMVLLDKLLRRLAVTGHRVLVFSQMVRVLDIISDYMRLRGFQHQRLDGSTPAQQRHQAMEHFNAPGSSDFAFLLSTRAGGLGINLATADTVIIFDSDWNPQNDLQAMSRAHRIGQKDTVNIYRFVTSGSVEEDILERAKRKMVLDHLVIQRMDTSGRTVLGAGGGQEQAKQMFGKEEMAAILRFGAEGLFAEGEEEAKDQQQGKAVMEEDLDAILARAEVVQDTGEPQGTGRMGDLLGQFNVATFKTSEDDAAFWNRLIPEEQRPKEQRDVIEGSGIRSSRLRQYDAEQLAAAVEEELPGGAGGAEFSIGGKKKKGGGGGGGSKKRGQEPGAPVEGAVLRIDAWPEEVDGQGGVVGPRGGARPADFPPTLSRKDAAAFAKAARQRGVISKLGLICKDAGGAVEAAGERARLALWFGLQRACQDAQGLVRDRHPEQQLPGGGGGGGGGGGTPTPSAAGGGGGSAAPQASAGGPTTSATSGGGGGGGGPEVSSGGGAGGGKGGSKHAKAPDAKLDWFGVEIRAQELLDILRQWRLVEGKVAGLPEPLAASLKLAAAECPPLAQWMRGAEWGPREDSALLLGCWRHGINAWESMAADPDLAWLAPKLQLAVADAIKSSGKDRETRERHALAMARILHPEKLPKASYLETRAYGILRQIEKIHLKGDKPAGGHGGGAKTRAASRPPLPPGSAGAGGRGPGAASRISPALAAVQHAAAHAAAQGGGPRRQVDEAYQAAENVLGAQTMTVVRKIRTLQRKGGEMDAKLVVQKTKKYLAAIGEKIEQEAVGDEELRHSLWEFVSHYTENQESGEQLEHLYERMKQHQDHHPPRHHAGAGAGGGSGGSGSSAAPPAAATVQPPPAAPQEEGGGGQGLAAVAVAAPQAAVPPQQATQQQAAPKAEPQQEAAAPAAQQAPAAAVPVPAEPPQALAGVAVVEVAPREVQPPPASTDAPVQPPPQPPQAVAAPMDVDVAAVQQQAALSPLQLAFEQLAPAVLQAPAAVQQVIGTGREQTAAAPAPPQPASLPAQPAPAAADGAPAGAQGLAAGQAVQLPEVMQAVEAALLAPSGFAPPAQAPAVPLPPPAAAVAPPAAAAPLPPAAAAPYGAAASGYEQQAQAVAQQPAATAPADPTIQAGPSAAPQQQYPPPPPQP